MICNGFIPIPDFFVEISETFDNIDTFEKNIVDVVNTTDLTTDVTSLVHCYENKSIVNHDLI